MNSPKNGHTSNDATAENHETSNRSPKDPAQWERLLERAEQRWEEVGHPAVFRCDGLIHYGLFETDCEVVDVLCDLATQLEGLVNRAEAARDILIRAVALGVLEPERMAKAEVAMRKIAGYRGLISEINGWFERNALETDGRTSLDSYRGDMMTEWQFAFARRLELAAEGDVEDDDGVDSEPPRPSSSQANGHSEATGGAL